MPSINWLFLLVLVPTVCYAGAALGFYLKGHNSMVVVYVGYTLANFGFLKEALK
jgi:hypothetical protein